MYLALPPSETRADLKTQFDALGYCVADNLWTQSQIDEIEVFFEDYRLTGPASTDPKITFDNIDPKKEQVRAMHPHRHSPRALAWMLNPLVGNLLERLLGKPALGVQTMYYFKPPGAKGQGMHQDNFYLVARPATCIAAWTAIDDAEIDNGCLYVVPGSHRGDVLCPEEGHSERWLDYGDSHISRFPRDTKPVPVPVRRGQTMFFGGNLIHGSGPNRTKDRSRRTFIGHYVDENTASLSHFYHPVHNMRGEVVSQIGVDQSGSACGGNAPASAH